MLDDVDAGRARVDAGEVENWAVVLTDAGPEGVAYPCGLICDLTRGGGHGRDERHSYRRSRN